MNYNQDYEYEEEIDLVKLIWFCMSKWKSIISCVLIGAVLGGTIAVAASNISFSKEKNISIYTDEYIDEKIAELQENNAEIATQAVTHAMNMIEESKLIGIDPYNMYVGSLNMFAFTSLENLTVIESAFRAFNTDEALYNELLKTFDSYNKKDLQKLVWLSASNQSAEDINHHIGTITAYGSSEDEVDQLLKEADRIVKDYLESFSRYNDAPYYSVKSDITLTEHNAIADYQKELYDNLIKAISTQETMMNSIDDGVSIAVYIVFGALLAGCVSVGIWIIVFFTCGKLYTVSDIEKKFRVKLFGSVSVCDSKNPLDKWLFQKINGLYSEFSEEEQQKIILLNIKNELKKNENMKRVMLVSSLGESVKESAQFIITELEEADYTVSEFMNIIGRTDNLEKTEDYDTVIIVEDKNESKTNLTAIECSTIKEYISSVSGLVLV